MHSTIVLDAITKLPREFSPDDQERRGPRLISPSLRLRDPLGGFLTELNWNWQHHLQDAPFMLDEAALRRTTRECGHYFSNICVLLWFFHDYLGHCRRVTLRRRRPVPAARHINALAARSRPIRRLVQITEGWRRSDEFLLDAQSYLLPIQVDKLLSDVRSFLSSVYQLAQVFTPPDELAKLPRSKEFRESFGKFADRYDRRELPSLALPLALLEEVVPWGQTVRALRDTYVHHGKSSIAMPRLGARGAATQVYFDLHGFSRGPSVRDLPDALYATDNPNDLLDLELLVLYIAVPVFALRHSLGETQRAHHARSHSEWKTLGEGSSLGGGGISALGAMLRRRPEILDADIYRFRRRKPGAEAT